MWNENGYGWTKTVESKPLIKEGYHLWQIVRRLDGGYDVKISNFGMTEVFASGLPSLEAAKEIILDAEDYSFGFGYWFVLGLALIGIVTTAALAYLN